MTFYRREIYQSDLKDKKKKKKKNTFLFVDLFSLLKMILSNLFCSNIIIKIKSSISLL